MNVTGPALAEGPETARIRAFLGGAGANGGRTDPAVAITLPVGDDAAAFRPPDGTQVVVSCDASVEGVHFRREWMTWETIGYRAAASALSDLAAMAATPVGLTVAAALPPELDVEIAAALGRGVGEIAGRVGAEVLGGDLVASPGPAFLDVTVLGYAAAPIDAARGASGRRAVGDRRTRRGCGRRARSGAGTGTGPSGASGLRPTAPPDR